MIYDLKSFSSRYGLDGHGSLRGASEVYTRISAHRAPGPMNCTHYSGFSPSTRRLLKYTRQGYTACDGCIAKLLESIADDPALIRADTKYLD